jgi:hypothetical protein
MADNLQENWLIFPGDQQTVEEQKKFDPNINKRSVVQFPKASENSVPQSSLLLQFAEVADEFVVWGAQIKQRDAQLREFWKKEPLLASAVYSACIRNASFDWEIVNSDPTKRPHKNTIQAVTTILRNSDRGLGWDEFIKKICVDLYTQDNGAFIEVIRSRNDPSAPVLNIAHIDSYRCERTGNPKIPVIYTDRDGIEHKLRWYQVLTLEEFPSPEESVYGIQVCAVSRALKAAQIVRDINLYKHEKIGGRNAGALHVIGGVQQKSLDEVRARHEERLNNLGMMRYSSPMIFSSLDPTSQVSHVQVDLASLPDGYDEQTTFQWYIAQLAIAFGVDYQEFAPLPSSNNIGSSGQSEILHMKTRGKGPATIMSLIEHTLNYSGILPKIVKFQFKIQDMRAEAEKAKASFDRGKDRSVRIQSSELDPEAAIQLALEAGDLPEHIAVERLARLEEQRVLQQQQQEENEAEPEFGAEQVTSGAEAHME